MLSLLIPYIVILFQHLNITSLIWQSCRITENEIEAKIEKMNQTKFILALNWIVFFTDTRNLYTSLKKDRQKGYEIGRTKNTAPNFKPKIKEKYEKLKIWLSKRLYI